MYLRTLSLSGTPIRHNETCVGMTHQPSRRTQHPSSLLAAGLLQLRPSCGRAGPGTVPLLFTSVQASASLCMQTPPQLSTPWSEAVPPQSTLAKFVMEGLGTGSPLRHSVSKRVPTYQNRSYSVLLSPGDLTSPVLPGRLFCCQSRQQKTVSNGKQAATRSWLQRVLLPDGSHGSNRANKDFYRVKFCNFCCEQQSLPRPAVCPVAV